MFVVFDKKSGFVRVTCTENPLYSVRFVADWYKHYDIMEFPYMDFIRASDIAMQVKNKQLNLLGNFENLRAQGINYNPNYAKLFEGE